MLYHHIAANVLTSLSIRVLTWELSLRFKMARLISALTFCLMLSGIHAKVISGPQSGSRLLKKKLDAPLRPSFGLKHDDPVVRFLIDFGSSFDP